MTGKRNFKKKIGDNKKVKNAKKVDMRGNVITTTIPIWKKEHPGEIYFDSYVEYYFWTLLKENNIEFELKKILPLYPKRKLIHWGFTPEEDAIRSDAGKGDETPADKAATTRWFNQNYKKKLTLTNLPMANWKPDFYLPIIKAFVDTKGNITSKEWRFKYKAIAEKLEEKGQNVIALQTQKDCREFIQHLKEKKYVK